ncbi:hypothetical protein BC828DRAFT_412087 [Blastocladiella britannica]|nr:hypothetical protein BC828DRAFT_412087 [Blastocladiella britannica]
MQQQLGHIDTIIDRVLGLAALGNAFSLQAVIPLLAVVPECATRDTHRIILRRFVHPVALAALGRPDLQDMHAGKPFRYSLRDMNDLMVAASAHGHISILEWAYARRPDLEVIDFENFLFLSYRMSDMLHAAVEHGQKTVLEWVTARGLELNSDLEPLCQLAVQYGQLDVLTYLRDYSHEWGQDFDLPLDWLGNLSGQPATSALVTMAEYALDFATSINGKLDAEFLVPYAAGRDDSTLLLEWAFAHCDALPGMRWPALGTGTAFHTLASQGHLHRCQWLYAKALECPDLFPGDRLIDLTRAREVANPAFLDWWWELTLHHGGDTKDGFHLQLIGIESSQPSDCCPFPTAESARWWWDKVQQGHFPATIFQRGGVSPWEWLDFLNLGEQLAPASVDTLEWWWEHRDAAGLPDSFNESFLAGLAAEGALDQLRWAWAVCAVPTSLPVTAHVICTAIEESEAQVVEWFWGMHRDYGTPFALPSSDDESGILIKRGTRSPARVMLDLFLDLHERMGGVPIAPTLCYQSALRAWIKHHLVQLDWWVALHKSHGAPFPSVQEMRQARSRRVSEPEVVAWFARHGLQDIE